MGTLRFDGEKAAKDLLATIEDMADKAIAQFYLEADPGGVDDIEIGAEPAIKWYIHDYVVFGADAIMKSFGTGSKMDGSNRYLERYIGSDLWNSIRYGATVVGREAGEYTNIYGERVKSTGAYAGQDLEKEFYEPIAPTYTIQNAEKWVEQKGGWLDQFTQRTIYDWIEKRLPLFFFYK